MCMCADYYIWLLQKNSIIMFCDFFCVIFLLESSICDLQVKWSDYTVFEKQCEEREG